MIVLKDIQGDVMLVPVKCFPNFEGIVPKQDRTVALGEHSGHAHVVENGEVFEIDGEMYVVAGSDGASLMHINTNLGGVPADHHPIFLTSQQVYKVILQRQHDYASQLSVRVND